MSRPNFLPSPGMWARRRSGFAEAVRYACAVEVPRRNAAKDLIRAILCVAACALIGALLAQAI